MKSLNDVMLLIAEAILKSQSSASSQFFIDYSGHVNQLTIKYYLCGWDKEGKHPVEKFERYLNDDDSIQEAYYFLKNCLK